MNDETLKECVELNEVRRPGFGKLLQRLALQYPNMDNETLLTHTKVVYTSPTIIVRDGSKRRMAPNPDYQAARDR